MNKVRIGGKGAVMGLDIHPTAIVAADANIGENCSIGPYCVVTEQVTLGAGTRLHSHVVVDGHTTLGRDCAVFPFACIGKQTQDLKADGGLAFVEIGDRTTLREYVTVNAGTVTGEKTVIGSHCHILAYCHIAHNCVLGDQVIMSNATQLAGHVVVEDAAVFGGMVGVCQFGQIGRLAMLSAKCKIVQDIVPYCLVDGSPALPVTINKIGLQRHGKSAAVIAAVGDAFRILFRSRLSLAEAVAQLRRDYAAIEEVQHMADFAAASERGIARPRSA